MNRETQQLCVLQGTAFGMNSQLLHSLIRTLPPSIATNVWSNSECVWKLAALYNDFRGENIKSHFPPLGMAKK